MCVMQSVVICLHEQCCREDAEFDEPFQHAGVHVWSSCVVRSNDLSIHDTNMTYCIHGLISAYAYFQNYALNTQYALDNERQKIYHTPPNHYASLVARVHDSILGR